MENQTTEQNQTQPGNITPVTGSPTPLDLAALESMLTEAEQRGYDRARAEFAQAQMNLPSVGEQPAAPAVEVSEELFLKNIRPSIWD